MPAVGTHSFQALVKFLRVDRTMGEFGDALQAGYLEESQRNGILCLWAIEGETGNAWMCGKRL
jgi:hypothetical protein